MSEVALTGNDTAILNNRILTGLADGDSVVLDFPNEVASLKVGKNKNVIYALNSTGLTCTVVFRLIRGSDDDKYMNALKTQQDNNFASTVLNTGEFIKKIGDGKGNVQKDVYILSGGIITKGVAAKSNAEGDTEQSVAVYNMTFALAPRAIT